MRELVIVIGRTKALNVCSLEVAHVEGRSLWQWDNLYKVTDFITYKQQFLSKSRLYHTFLNAIFWFHNI